MGKSNVTLQIFDAILAAFAKMTTISVLNIAKVNSSEMSMIKNLNVVNCKLFSIIVKVQLYAKLKKKYT